MQDEQALCDMKELKFWLYEESSKDRYCTLLASYQILSIFDKKCIHASVNTNRIQVSYFFSQNGLFGGLFSFCIVCMDDLLRRWGKTMLEMDGKLVFETTAEMDGKLDTWTTQAMYEQQRPQ